MGKQGKHYPQHIDPDKLPACVGYEARWGGRWYYRKSRGRGDRGKPLPFGCSLTTLAEIWQHVDTFKGISLTFQESEDWMELAAKIRIGYANIHKAVRETETKTGEKLGDVPLDAWSPGTIRRYLAQKGNKSKSSATAHVRYIKRVFSMAISMDYYLKPNPAKEVRIKGATARAHYVQDEDYYLAITVAPLSIGLAAHLAYLTGHRRTGKLTIVDWSDELHATVEIIKSEADASMYLFPRRGAPGERFDDSAFDTAWQRVRGKVRKVGGVPFQFKGIRANHSSDFDTDEEAQHNLRHSSNAVTKRHYRRKPTQVKRIR
jgi:hypothetical protein